MDSTVILTMARSGSTFFNVKLLGMLDAPFDQTHHNEIAFEEFFIKHKIEHLIKHDNIKHTIKENQTHNFDPRIHHRLLETRKYSDQCYYSVDQYTIEKHRSS